MVVQLAATDRLFHALADATRRDIVGRVLAADRSVTELSERYAMSFAAVQKHVAVLERAGLVTKRRVGREARVSGNAATLRYAADLLDRLEQIGRARFAQIDDLVATLHPGDDP